MKKEFTKKIVCVIILAAIGCGSFFAAAPWAKNPATYEKTIETLDSLENKAIAMTGTSAALATAAAMVPGDTTTPIANKLADVAGYMVIVYVAIILEKYLITIMGFAAFRILIPIALLLVTISIFLTGDGIRASLRRIAGKFAVLGLLLWALVPTSAAVTDMINDTYDISYGGEYLSDIEIGDAAEPETADKNSEKGTQSELEESEKKDNFFKNLWNDIAEKTEAVTDEVKDKVSEGAIKFQNALSQMIEGVAVMIVTTCVIPICVLMLFLWIVKMISGLNFNMPNLKKLPKASKLLKKSSEEISTEA